MEPERSDGATRYPWARPESFPPRSSRTARTLRLSLGILSLYHGDRKGRVIGRIKTRALHCSPSAGEGPNVHWAVTSASHNVRLPQRIFGPVGPADHQKRVACRRPREPLHRPGRNPGDARKRKDHIGTFAFFACAAPSARSDLPPEPAPPGTTPIVVTLPHRSACVAHRTITRRQAP